MHRAEEREAKFDGVEGDLPDFSGLIDRARVVEPPPAHLVAVYVDTEDLVLLRRGMTLRHRHDARGGESGWTLKLPNGTGKAAFERVEISWSGPPDRVPEEAERLLRPLTGSAALVPVAELTTDRRRLELRDEDGGRLAEVDDDRVTVSVPQVTHFRQVEVELHEADDSLLDELAGRLRAAGAERSPDEPKIRRALEPWLREAESRPPPPPAPTSTVGELVAAAITDGLERLLAHDTGVRLDQGAEFVHQARVATRRLRSDLKTLGEVLDAEWVRTTRRELKWVADHLGAVRDADVLLARLQRIAAESAPDDAGAMAALREHLS
ncbi:MAG TPA: CHAD domain-containing protein, partial [Acidimicrobiales bacterium]|nr:CHAD domain-containing protein [Acidimicrobiales bacterium]